MQTTLLTLAIAVILALLAALVGPHFVDWNAQRANFEQQASQLIGLPVRVAGKMDVRLLPSPTLVLGGVEIGQPGDPSAVRATALGIEFALPPLLSGKLRAVEMRVIGPQLRLALDQDGRAALPPALSGFNVEALSIEKLAIEDAQLELADAASGTRVALSKLWFNGEVKSLPGPFRGEGAFVHEGGLYSYRIASSRPEAAGLRLKFTLEPAEHPFSAELEGLVSAENGRPRFDGNAAVFRRLAKDTSADPWRLSARMKGSAAAALFEQLEFQLGPDERALKLTGTAEAQFGARPQIDAVLTARTLDADKFLNKDENAQRPRATLTALLAQAAALPAPPIPVQLGFGIDSIVLGGNTLQNLRGDIEWRGKGIILSGFELRAPGLTQLQASGQIAPRDGTLAFAGPVNLSSLDPRAFIGWLEGKDTAAAIGIATARLRGEVTATADSIAVERMVAELDRKKIEGAFAYAKAAGPNGARLTATLRAEELDLDAVMQLSQSLGAGSERPDSVVLALSLARLRAFGLEAANAEIQLALDKSALAVNRFSLGDIAGVTVESKGTIDLQTPSPRGNLNFELAARDAASLTSLLERVAPPESRLTRLPNAGGPGKITGRLSVEPGSRAGASRASLNLSGTLAALTLDMKSSFEGEWSNPAAAQVNAHASLQAEDLNAVLRFAAAEPVIALPRQKGSLTLSINGKADGDLAVDTRLSSADIDARANGTLRWFGQQHRSGALDVTINKAGVTFARGTAPGQVIPIALKTTAKFSPATLRLDNVAANIAGSALRGRVGVTFGRPAGVEGELRADALDLGAVLTVLGLAGDPSASKTDGAKPPTDKSWSEAPFAPPVLPPLSGDIQLSAGQLQLTPALRAANARALLRFNGEEISARSLQGDMLGGRAAADLTLRRGGETVGIRGQLSIKDADAAALLAAGNAATLIGRASLEAQLEGAGLSPRALLGSLSGGGKLTLTGLRVNGIDPKAVAAAARAVDQGLPIDPGRIRDVVTRALDAGALSIPDGSAALSLAGGVARVESFTARAEGADLVLSGSYNLVQSLVDLRLTVIGPASAGLTVRPEFTVSLRGPAAAPQRSIDVSSLTGWLALRSVEQQTKRIEEIERGRAEPAAKPQETERRSAIPEPTPVPAPRRAPAPAPTAPPQSPAPVPAPRSEAVQPLPPPIEIRPAPGDRRRAPVRETNPAPVETEPPPPPPSRFDIFTPSLSPQTGPVF